MVEIGKVKGKRVKRFRNTIKVPPGENITGIMLDAINGSECPYCKKGKLEVQESQKWWWVCDTCGYKVEYLKS